MGSAHPGEVKYSAEKDSRQINILEQNLIAKVYNFGRICSGSGGHFAMPAPGSAMGPPFDLSASVLPVGDEVLDHGRIGER